MDHKYLSGQCFTVDCHGRSNVLFTQVELNDPVTNPLPEGLFKMPAGKNKYVGIWDTGASASAISTKVISEMGLVPIGMASVNTAGGVHEQGVYLVDIRLPNNVVAKSVRVTGANFSSADLLIGMDIIGAGDFSVTTRNGATVFSYRIPSLECIDFVQTQKDAIKCFYDQGRNNMCGCGSMKRYKDCHGLLV